MKKGIRWGILGPGKIAITFAEAVNLIGEDVIVAVASHDERKAAAFAAEHQIAHGYGSYEELVSRGSRTYCTPMRAPSLAITL